jgi:hypothetical protein
MILEQSDTVVVVQANDMRIAHVSTPASTPHPAHLRIAAAIVAGYILQASTR